MTRCRFFWKKHKVSRYTKNFVSLRQFPANRMFESGLAVDTCYQIYVYTVSIVRASMCIFGKQVTQDFGET